MAVERIEQVQLRRSGQRGVQCSQLLREDELKKLLKTCEGADFYAKRDLAILRLFIDTGMRLAELNDALSDLVFYLED